MKLDQFIISYNGNKYRETKKHLKDVDISKYDIIAEPFCGIYGCSRALFEMNPNYKGQFWLNDYDENLIRDLKRIKKEPENVINDLMEEVKKYKEDKEMTDDKNKSYLSSLVFRGRQPTLMELSKGNTKLKNYNKKIDDYKKFYNKVKFFNMDYSNFIEKLPKKKKILIFFDPPYLDSNNQNYKKFSLSINRKEFYDPSTLYLKIKDIFDSKKYDCLAIYNYFGLLDYFYKEYKADEIISRYGGGNFKKHIIYKTIN